VTPSRKQVLETPFPFPRWRIVDLLWLILLVALLMAWARFLPSFYERSRPLKVWHAGAEALVAIGYGSIAFLSFRTGWYVRILNWLNKRRPAEVARFGMFPFVPLTIRLLPLGFLIFAPAGILQTHMVVSPGVLIGGSIALGMLVAIFVVGQIPRPPTPVPPPTNRDKVDSNPPSA
jgi:hypothetical protein